jgi:hypothetical protein
VPLLGLASPSALIPRKCQFDGLLLDRLLEGQKVVYEVVADRRTGKASVENLKNIG